MKNSTENDNKGIYMKDEAMLYPDNDYRDYIKHHGVKGQKWGIQNGPPYPLNQHSKTIIFKDDDTDEERDAKVREVVRRNLSGMRTSEIDTTVYKRYVFKYEDGTVHETRKGETPEEIRDIRDFKISYEMANKEYRDRISGKSKENIEEIRKSDEKMRRRAKKYGIDSKDKYLTIGIPHSSKAYSINRFDN